MLVILAFSLLSRLTPKVHYYSFFVTLFAFWASRVAYLQLLNHRIEPLYNELNLSKMVTLMPWEQILLPGAVLFLVDFRSFVLLVLPVNMALNFYCLDLKHDILKEFNDCRAYGGSEEILHQQHMQEIISSVVLFVAIYANAKTTATRFITHLKSSLQEKMLTRLF